MPDLLDLLFRRSIAQHARRTPQIPVHRQLAVAVPAGRVAAVAERAGRALRGRGRQSDRGGRREPDIRGRAGPGDDRRKGHPPHRIRQVLLLLFISDLHLAGDDYIIKK